MRKKDISDAIGNINDRYIEEAADFQRKKKRTGKSSILQKSVAAAASFILVFILSVSTLVAADFSPAYEFLYTLSPSAAQKLKPVSMISEDNGYFCLCRERRGEDTYFCTRFGGRQD